MQSPYRLLLSNFLINNCPCSVKLFLAVRSIHVKVDIANSKENWFIPFQILRNKHSTIFLPLFKNSFYNVLFYVLLLFVVGAYIKI